MQIENLISCLKKTALDGVPVKISSGVWLESGESILEDLAGSPCDTPDLLADEVYLVTDDGHCGSFSDDYIERILIDSFDATGKIEIVCE